MMQFMFTKKNKLKKPLKLFVKNEKLFKSTRIKQKLGS